jgi:hypothetical protein
MITFATEHAFKRQDLKRSGGAEWRPAANIILSFDITYLLITFIPAKIYSDD